MRPIAFHRYDLRKPLPGYVESFLDEHGKSIFLTSDWLKYFSRSGVEQADSPFLLSGEAGGRPRCVIPLLRTCLRRNWISMPMLASLTNYYALDYAAVCEPGAEDVLGDALARERAPIVRFDSMGEEAARQLESGLRAAGFWPRRFDAFVNWTEELSGESFDNWFRHRSSQLRNTWRRRLKKLVGLSGARINLFGGPALPRQRKGESPGLPVETDGTLERLVDAWTDVYARSWKQPEPFPDFVPGLIRLSARRGWLRLGVLYLAQRPIAAQLWLNYRGRSTIYKLAYDEVFREFSPGLALSVEMFRHAIDADRVAVIDYGSGDDAYKKDWMSTRQVRVGLEAFDRRHPLGLAAAMVDEARRRMFR